jgi:hypothetical protein
MTKPPPDGEGLHFRAGAGALGLFAGVAIGLLLAWLAYAVLSRVPSFPILLFGGAAAGLVAGLILPAETLLMVETLAHFLIGLFAASVDEDLEEGSFGSRMERPRYLRLAVIFGVALALVLAIFSILH